MPAEPETDPVVAELLREGRHRARLPLEGRERMAEAVVGGAFVVAAVAMAVLLHADRAFEWGPALALVAAFAAASRVQLDVGAGYTIPVQVVFVPMLLLLPTPLVPLLVCAAWLIGQIPDVVARRMHPERLLLSIANSWFAVGPAAVLVACDAQLPDLGDWWAYVLAFAAQVGCDMGANQARERLARHTPPPLRVLEWVYVIDALLSPVGLLAALAAEQESPYVVLLLAPAMALFAFFGRERSRRLADALALGDREREAAELTRRLLEAEREATRGREEILAGASSAALTPLAALSGLVSRLRATEPADTDRRKAVEGAMLREVQEIRHLVGQFLDYARLKAGRELVVEPVRTELGPLVRQAAESFPEEARVVVEIEDELPAVQADPGRVLQILLSLVSNAVKFSPPWEPVTITVTAVEDGVELAVADRGSGIAEDELAHVFGELRRGHNASGAEGVGLGLYLARLLAEAQGGRVTVTSRVDEGSTFTLSLPLPAVTDPERRRRLRRLRPLH